MNNQNKLISIGLPVYNGANRIRRALDSLLSQTYKNFELIISDNASTDETEKICKEYARKDNRIKYLRQKENIGQVNNLIFVLKEARGEYFMWAADDDWREEAFIEQLAGALEKNTKHDIAMCSYRNIYSDGAVKNTIFMADEYNLTNQDYYSVYKKIILNKPIHHFLHGLFRRKFLLQFFQRPMPKCIRWDRIFMSELALAAHFYSVKPLLFLKNVAREPITTRYANDMVGKTFADCLAHSRYYFTIPAWLLMSSVIPPSRKLLIFIPWARLGWLTKRTIIKELISWCYLKFK